MNIPRAKLLIIPVLLLLLLLATSCGNESDVQKAVAPDPVTQDSLSAKEDPASPTNTTSEWPATKGKPLVTTGTDDEEMDSEQSPSTVAPVEAATGNPPAEKPVTDVSSVKAEGEVEAEVEAAGEVDTPTTITISITGDEDKGVILEPTTWEWEEGDDVLDVLKEVTKSNKIPLEYKGAGVLTYVEGIGNLYEFDQGSNSGWLFKINGKFATRSAGAVKLNIGDNVEWIYSIKVDEESAEE
jgi:hypothetical protein